MCAQDIDPRDVREERIRQISEDRQRRLREMEIRMEEARREIAAAERRAQDQERRRVELMRFIDSFLDRREP